MNSSIQFFEHPKINKTVEFDTNNRSLWPRIKLKRSFVWSKTVHLHAAIQFYFFVCLDSTWLGAKSTAYTDQKPKSNKSADLTT